MPHVISFFVKLAYFNTTPLIRENTAHNMIGKLPKFDVCFLPENIFKMLLLLDNSNSNFSFREKDRGAKCVIDMKEKMTLIQNPDEPSM